MYVKLAYNIQFSAILIQNKSTYVMWHCIINMFMLYPYRMGKHFTSTWRNVLLRRQILAESKIFPPK